MVSCDADCQPSAVQVLRELLQEHGSLDSDGVLRGGLSLRHHEVRAPLSPVSSVWWFRLRKKTLTEEQIAIVLSDTLKGLEYLHLRKKIHRDIKAGNILLNMEVGDFKLQIYGVNIS